MPSLSLTSASFEQIASGSVYGIDEPTFNHARGVNFVGFGLEKCLRFPYTSHVQKSKSQWGPVDGGRPAPGKAMGLRSLLGHIDFVRQA
jgi:hypothetical protein